MSRFLWELQSGHGITTNQSPQGLVRSTSSSPVLGSKKARPGLLDSFSQNSKERSRKISLALCRCFASAQKKGLKACFGQLDMPGITTWGNLQNHGRRVATIFVTDPWFLRRQRRDHQTPYLPQSEIALQNPAWLCLHCSSYLGKKRWVPSQLSLITWG